MNDHVAVLRNMLCGHVAAIVTTDQTAKLYRRLFGIRKPGWVVRIEPNTAAIYDDLLGGPCPTCHLI